MSNTIWTARNINVFRDSKISQFLFTQGKGWDVEVVNWDVPSSALSNLLSPKWSDLFRLSHPTSRTPSHSRSCSSSCHAGSFSACQENEPSSAGTRLSPFLTPFPKLRDLLASSTWRRSTANLGRERNTIIHLLNAYTPTTEAGGTGAPKFWRRQRHSGVSQHRAWHMTSITDIPAVLVLHYLALFGSEHLHTYTNTCLGLDFSTYLSTQPSVQSHESTNTLEKLLR